MVQLFQATPDRGSWSKFRTGVACFVKDNVKKSYYIRLLDIGVSEIESDSIAILRRLLTLSTSFHCCIIILLS